MINTIINKIFFMVMLIILASCGGGGDGGGSSSTNNTPPPVIVQPEEISLNVLEESFVSINIPDELVVVELVESPINGTITFINNSWIYTAGNQPGQDRAKFKVIKNEEETFLTINIEIIEVNVAPVAEDIIIFVERGSGKLFNLLANDDDNDSLSYELVGAPDLGRLSLRPSNSAEWGFDAPNLEGVSTFFTYRVFDGKEYSNQATVTINITRLNNIPTEIGYMSNISVEEDSSYSFDISVQDVDGDSISVFVDKQGINGNASISSLGNNNYRISYVPVPNFVGTDNFLIKIDDGIGGILEKNTAVIVSPTNDKPVIGNTSFTLSVEKNSFGNLLDINVSDVDNDLGDLSIVELTNSSLADFFFTESGKINLTPKFNAVGNEVILLTITDGEDTADEIITINLEIYEEKLPIVPINDVAVVDQGSSVAITLDAQNIENRNVEFQIVNEGDGVVTGIPPEIIFTPNENFYGNTFIRFKVVEDGVESSIGFVDVTVNRTNFSNTWSLDYLGNLYENQYSIEDSNYVLDNRFFISQDESSLRGVFSLFTDNMSCAGFSDEFVWSGVLINNRLDNFDISEGWFCFDQFYLYRETIEEIVSAQEIEKNIIKENIFSNNFNYNESNRFGFVEQIDDCSFVTEYSDLNMDILSLSIQQEDCIKSIGLELVNNIDIIEDYYVINDLTSIHEGVFSLVKDFLNYSKQKDEQNLSLTKIELYDEIVNKNKFYFGEPQTFVRNFSSCRDYINGFSGTPNQEEDPTGDGSVTVFDYLINEPYTQSQQECFVEVFNFIEKETSFYSVTEFQEPMDKLNYSSLIGEISVDFITYLETTIVEYNEELCESSNMQLYDFYFRSKVLPTESLQEYLQRVIPSCSTDILFEGAENYLDFFYVYAEYTGIPDSTDQTQCQMDILSEIGSKEFYSYFNLFKGLDGNFYEDLNNKSAIAFILDTVKKYDREFCEPSSPTINKEEYIYNSQGFLVYNKKASKNEIYLGYNKNDISYTIDYSSLNFTNAKRISLISGSSMDLTENILYKNLLKEDNVTLGDFIKLPWKKIDNKDVYLELVVENGELVVQGIYLDNGSNLLLHSDIYIGKSIILDNRMVFTINSKDLGYYLIELF